MLNEKQIPVINNWLHPKFLATVDQEGQPNIVIVSSLEYFEGELIFGNLMLWKTAQNLQDNPETSILVIDPQLNYFFVEGIFKGFAESGPATEHLQKSDMVRYNAYTGFRNTGTIEITHVSPLRQFSPVRILGKYVQSRINIARRPVYFPKAVADKFSAMKSIKVVAYYDGKLHIEIVPAVRCSGDYLHTSIEFPPGVKYAANVITPEVVSFQVRGTVKEKGLHVAEIYACGPPVPGKKIYPLSPS